MSTTVPPTAGTAATVRLAAVRTAALSADEVLTAVGHPAAGGTAVFVGTVRDHDAGRGVSALSYSAHPLAETRIREIAERLAAEVPDILAVAALHRVGDLVVGDAAIAVAVATAHRAPAFDACRELVERIKHQVPIWKHQTYTDGDRDWVNCTH
ncbi:molybdenum cofactor biosynthesis protein MoaE [Streptomyces sp. SID3343]|uniref:molybdenum cofactor biosynthesis protein MoaE n=1 Tax=Streptomyces sp. SID3343 TaxID=2690260 RepID=UPI00136A7B69|nr:molybdenum cofactor biosynthesis protein MoaE [Streptomyces sp. SID3343]MYW00070.1 molybdenum cofactor biosynthesis protein MoaE [Streptomyces sp. SID3343]